MVKKQREICWTVSGEGKAPLSGEGVGKGRSREVARTESWRKWRSQPCKQRPESSKLEVLSGERAQMC